MEFETEGMNYILQKAKEYSNETMVNGEGLFAVFITKDDTACLGISNLTSKQILDALIGMDSLKEQLMKTITESILKRLKDKED